LCERHAWIVGTHEPVVAPVAAGFQGFWEAITRRLITDAAVLGTPASTWGSPFVGAAVEDTDAAAGNLRSVRTVHDWNGFRERTLRSNWLPARSEPVLVACTIIFFPLTGPLVKVNS